MKRFLKIILFSLVIICPAYVCRAQEVAEPAKRLKGIEVLTGFGSAKLRDKGSYHPIPVLVDFDFDLKPLTKKIGINPPGLIEFNLEPFVAYSYQPDNNAEIGNNFLLKVGFFPETWKFQPYFRGGLGFVYLTQHTREQGSQFNFNEYAGLGAHYYFKKNIGLTIEYRYRHVSNAGIDKPNKGINTNYGLCGISYLF